jgi:hypothetical protein
MRSACLPPHRALAYLYVSRLGVAFVSGEPKLHSIQPSLAIMALINPKRRVEVAGRVSIMFLGSNCADLTARSPTCGKNVPLNSGYRYF